MSNSKILCVYYSRSGQTKFLAQQISSLLHCDSQEIILKDKETKKPLDYRNRTGYQIYKKALEKGILLRPLGDVIYFNPPLIIDKNDMDFVVNVAYSCAKEVLDN